MSITFGFELEVSRGASNVLSILMAEGLTQHSRLHCYHCECDMCEPSTRGYAFKAQQDCTADGEFISKILTYGTAEADAAIVGLGRALLLGGAQVDGNVGNHVHVDHSGLDNDGQLRLYRLFARYEGELEDIASAGFDQERSYNNRRRVPTFEDTIWSDVANGRYHRHAMQTHKLSWKDPTVEFRLWNSTRAAWRIRTHVGLSVAMVLAAEAGVETSRHDTRCVEDTIGDFIDAPTWAGILRQRFSKGGLAAKVGA